MWTWFCTEGLRHGWLTGKFNVGVQACRAPVLQRFMTSCIGGILAARCSSGHGS
jgi:hypothetical protein